MTYYGYILLGSFLGPFLLSFDKKVAFYKKWSAVLISTILVAVPFLVWDSWFTHLGVWGFNPNYSSSLKFRGLPIEEILFFLVVPYCCLFVHEVIKAYFPKRDFKIVAIVLFALLFVLGIVLLILGVHNYYTLTACSFGILLILLLCFSNKVFFARIGMSYLVCLIPFLVVNGLLTGIATEEPVVWYSADHIVGWRIGTIPVEDLFYNLGLFLPIAWIYEKQIS